MAEPLFEDNLKPLADAQESGAQPGSKNWTSVILTGGHVAQGHKQGIHS